MYTQADYNILIERLYSCSDEGYKSFNNKIIPGIEGSIGVKIPKLRELAREIAKAPYWKEFLMLSSALKDKSYEEIQLQGLVIGYAKAAPADRLCYIKSFIPSIKNWAVCDVFASQLKFTSKAKPLVKSFLEPYLKSSDEFKVRFAVVMLMDYFLDDEYIDFVLNAICNLSHSGYYVKMGAAWAISVCFVKQREKTLPIFEEKLLDKDTHNKAIQKCLDSYRVSPEDKIYLKTLKIKGV